MQIREEEIFKRDKSFDRKSRLNCHLIMHKCMISKCAGCESTFSSEEKLGNYQKLHANLRYGCKICGMKFSWKSDFNRHLCKNSTVSFLDSIKSEIPLSKARSERLGRQFEALKIYKNLIFYPKKNEENDLDIFQENLQLELCQALKNEVILKNRIQWFINSEIELNKNRVIKMNSSFFKNLRNDGGVNERISNQVKEGCLKIKSTHEEYVKEEEASFKINYLELKIVKY